MNCTSSNAPVPARAHWYVAYTTPVAANAKPLMGISRSFEPPTTRHTALVMEGEREKEEKGKGIKRKRWSEVG